MDKVILDFETRSELEIDKVGSWTYAMHPSTDILCAGFGMVKRGPFEDLVTVRQRHEIADLGLLRAALEYPGTVVASFNAPFELAIWKYILHRRYGWPVPPPLRRWNCLMARALAAGFPGKLEHLGPVLHLKTPKDLEGRRVMLQLCHPKKDGTWDETPEKLKRLYRYNEVDIRSEMEVDTLVPELSAEEHKVWEHDVVMNHRGIKIDLSFASAASTMVDGIVDDLNGQLQILTAGRINKATQVPTIKQYLTEQGVDLPNGQLDKVAIVELSGDPEISDHARAVINIRRQVSKTTSTSKYAAVQMMVGPDGRVRGAIQAYAAHTGRDGGRLFQPQNIPKGFEHEAEQAEAISLVMVGDPALFVFHYGDRAMDVMSDALRGMIVASPGHQLYVSDFNAIEARKVFWFAADRDALDCYGRGESPYIQMANYIYGRTDITKKTHPMEYDIGKRSILGCGFGMGWKKFQENVYLETAKKGSPVWLEDDVAKRAVKGYRELHPNVPKMWYMVDGAAINAVRNPGQRFTVCDGKILYAMSNDRRFLVCRLPSGRYLWYYQPSIRMVSTHWCPEGHGKLDVTGKVCYCPECDKEYPAAEIRKTKPELHYWGKNPKTKQWCLLKTYGGALTENFVQASARDLMMNGMVKAEAAGFPIVLRVHDELIAEVPVAAGKTVEEYNRLLCDVPVWAAGCPVKAEGWMGTRYRK